MPIDVDQFTTPDTPTERKPGEFKRRTPNGSPIVTHPTETRKRKGKKADLEAIAADLGITVPPKATVAVLHELIGGEPAEVTYQRASGIGKPLDDTKMLEMKDRRMVAIGLALRPELLDSIKAQAERHDPNGKIDRDDEQAIDNVIASALNAAEHMRLADIGTAIHAVIEWASEGSQGERPWVNPAFNFTDEQIDAVAGAWLKLLADNELEVLATEQKIVNDVHEAAGSGDVYARLGRALPFVTADGDVVTIPTGEIVSIDAKTGTMRKDAPPPWWDGYLLQGLCYSGDAVPYDPDTGNRADWPHDPPSREHFLIAHLDVPLLRETNTASWRLIHGDLTACTPALTALEAMDEWHAAKKWAIAATASTVAAPSTSPDVEQPAAEEGNQTAPSSAATPPDRMKALEARYLTLADTDRAAFVALNVDMTDADAVEAALDSVDPLTQPPATLGGRTVTAEPVTAPKLTATTDEGPPVAPGVAKAIEARYVSLTPAQQAWVNAIAADAQRAGAPLGMRDNPTTRRAEAINALVNYALEFVTDEPSTDTDDMFRAVLAVVVGETIAWCDTFSLGQLVATIDAETAVTFGHTIHMLTNGLIAPTFTDNGRPQIATAPAA